MKRNIFMRGSFIILAFLLVFTVQPVNAKTSFIDFKENQYWSEGMDWATSKGIIQGVQAKNGVYLYPSRTLTEAEFIVTLFRLGSQDLMKKYSAEGDSWYRVPYLLAKGAGVSADKANVSKHISRGLMAKYLIQSLTDKDNISQQDAVSILYEMGVTQGKVVNGTTPKTYESYAPNDTLTRGEMVTFLYRLHNLEGSVLLPINETVVLKAIEDEIATIGSNIKSDISINGIKLGLSKVQVEFIAGKEKFVTPNDFGLDWHVFYKDDWTDFFMVAYQNNKVVQMYSNQSGITGIQRGMKKEQVQKYLGNTLVKSGEESEEYAVQDRFVTVYYDIHQENVVSSVFVSTKVAYLLKKGYYPIGSEKLERSYEKQIWALLNARRVAHGIKPLNWSDEAQVSSYKHSLDMAVNKYFSHTNLKNESPFDRMKSLGIRYSTAAENIAYGHSNPIHVIEAWMNSIGHRKNSLNEHLTHIGVGVYIREKDNVPYYTQNFLTPL